MTARRAEEMQNAQGHDSADLLSISATPAGSRNVRISIWNDRRRYRHCGNLSGIGSKIWGIRLAKAAGADLEPC